MIARTKWDRVMQPVPNYLALWGKSDRQPYGKYHPAAYHMLDVAACADAVTSAFPDRFQRLAESLSTTVESLRRSLVCLIGIHDLAKMSVSFQGMVPWLWQEGILGPAVPPPGPPRERHDGLLYNWLRLRLFAGGSLDASTWPVFDLSSARSQEAKTARLLPLLEAVCGHHGEPIEEKTIYESAYERTIGPRCEGHATAFLDDWFVLSAPVPIDLKSVALCRSLSWALSGLVVISDWLGSNSDIFPPLTSCGARPEHTLADYWEVATAKACESLARAGIMPLRPSVSSTVSALFGVTKPRPLQVVAQEVAIENGPTLAIVEDVTGAGKTEASLVLAHRIMASHKASGIYMAMPTMATANAMFDRLGKALARLFESGSLPSLSLVHGKAWLNPSFRPFDPRIAFDPASVGSDGVPTVAACCSDWIMDDRRKAFLAHIGAGTVDQALLAVMPVRFQSLRLFGLADKVLIVDEVHSYDAYTGSILAELVRFQATLGGSTILLSATLPSSIKHQIIAAYYEGLPGVRFEAESGGDAFQYPLMTLASPTSVRLQKINPVEDLKRQVVVRRLENSDDAEIEISDLHHAGLAVAYVRNSVDDAIETASKLAGCGLDPLLFHARFAMCD